MSPLVTLAARQRQAEAEWNAALAEVARARGRLTQAQRRAKTAQRAFEAARLDKLNAYDEEVGHA